MTYTYLCATIYTQKREKEVIYGKTYKCFRCGNLERYYLKGVRSFERAPIGFCKDKRQIVDVKGGCDRGCAKCGERLKRRFLGRALNDLLIQITEIRKYIEVVYNERNEEENENVR